MRILITGAGGAAAISVWKSLSAEHELHMADIDPLAAGLYLVPPDRRLIIPRGDAPELVPALHRACKERRIEALLPTVDAELAPVAAARDSFESIGVALPISPVECLRICRDKQLLMDAVQGKVPVPDSEPLTEAVAARVDVLPALRQAPGGRGVARRREDRQPRRSRHAAQGRLGHAAGISAGRGIFGRRLCAPRRPGHRRRAARAHEDRFRHRRRLAHGQRAGSDRRRPCARQRSSAFAVSPTCSSSARPTACSSCSRSIRAFPAPCR